MTEYERMEAGLLYHPGDKEIMDEQFSFVEKLYEFNQLRPTDFEGKEKYCKEVFAECGEDVFIELPSFSIRPSTEMVPFMHSRAAPRYSTNSTSARRLRIAPPHSPSAVCPICHSARIHRFLLPGP